MKTTWKVILDGLTWESFDSKAEADNELVRLRSGLEERIRKMYKDIEELNEKIKTEKDKFKKKRNQIQLEEKLWGRANMELAGRDRLRELKLWSKIKKELNDGSFDDKNVETHQFVALKKDLEHRVNSLTSNAGPGEVFNAVSQLETAKRLEKERSGK